MTRQRRVAYQPRGNAPGTCSSAGSALQGRRTPSPLQGEPIDYETQGVALGWNAAAPSAPESRLGKSEFTNLMLAIMRSLDGFYEFSVRERTPSPWRLRIRRV